MNEELITMMIVVIGIIFLISLVCILPTLCIILVGMWIASALGITGLYWYAFVVLFLIIIWSIIYFLRK